MSVNITNSTAIAAALAVAVSAQNAEASKNTTPICEDGAVQHVVEPSFTNFDFDGDGFDDSVSASVTLLNAGAPGCDIESLSLTFFECVDVQANEYSQCQPLSADPVVVNFTELPPNFAPFFVFDPQNVAPQTQNIQQSFLNKIIEGGNGLLVEGNGVISGTGQIVEIETGVNPGSDPDPDPDPDPEPDPEPEVFSDIAVTNILHQHANDIGGNGDTVCFDGMVVAGEDSTERTYAVTEIDGNGNVTLVTDTTLPFPLTLDASERVCLTAAGYEYTPGNQACGQVTDNRPQDNRPENDQACVVVDVADADQLIFSDSFEQAANMKNMATAAGMEITHIIEDKAGNQTVISYSPEM